MLSKKKPDTKIMHCVIPSGKFLGEARLSYDDGNQKNDILLKCMRINWKALEGITWRDKNFIYPNRDRDLISAHIYQKSMK